MKLNIPLVMGLTLCVSIGLVVASILLLLMPLDLSEFRNLDWLIYSVGLGLLGFAAVVIWRITRNSTPDGQLPPATRLWVIRLEIFALLGAIPTLLFAMWSIQQAANQSQLAQEALQDQRISSAWQIISQRASGSAGKGYALSILANETDEPLYGLSLGCTDLEPAADSFGNPTCRLPLLLDNLHLNRKSGRLLDISESDFRFVNLSNSTITGAILNDLDFSWSTMTNVEFRDSRILGTTFGDGVDARITGTWNYQRVGLMADVRFEDSVLFGADFSRRSGPAFLSAHISFADSVIWKADFSVPHDDLWRGEGEYLVFDESTLVQIDFTGRDFSPLGTLDWGPIEIDDCDRLAQRIDFKDVVFGMHDLEQINAGPPSQTIPQFNISGARFCSLEGWAGSKMVCWEDATQEFFDLAWFEPDAPPVGLEHLPFDVKLRPGCPWRQALSPEQRPFADSFEMRYVEEYCIALDPIPLSELDFDRPAIDYYPWLGP